MPLDRSKLKKIYNTLLDGGYEQSYEEFERAFEGNNYANRKKVYDLLMDNGGTAENLGGSYEEFMSRLYFKDGKSPGSRVTLDKKAPAPKKATPLQAKQPATEDKTTKLLDSVQSTLNENRRVQNRMDYAMGKTGLKTPETNLGWKGNSTLGFGGNVVETKRRDDVTGGEETVYLTESGNEYADMDSAQLEQGRIEQIKWEEKKRLEEKNTPVEGVWEGITKSGVPAMKAGLWNFGAEALAAITGSAKEAETDLAKLGKIGAERIEHTLFGKSSVYDKEAKELVEKYIGKLSPDSMKDGVSVYNGIKDYLSKEAQEKHWADDLYKNADEEMEKIRPTKGVGAWVGNLIPQMIPAATGMAVSLITRSPAAAKWTGRFGMGAMTASTMGSSMREARDAGASNGQIWGVGLADGAIEYLTEKIPFNRYTGRLLNSVKRETGEEVSRALTRGNSPARGELEKLLVKANNKLGGKLLNGKNVKDYLVDIAAEGASEFTAEALQTITPMIYQDPEEYPTLSEILENGWEGTKAGIFMGAALGSVSKVAEHKQERNRRKEQGFVDVVEFDDDGQKIGEVVGEDADAGELSVLLDGDVKLVSVDDVKLRHRFSFDEFDSGAMQAETDESFNSGYATTDPVAMTNARESLDRERSRMAELLGVEDGEVDEVVGDPLTFIAEHRELAAEDGEIQRVLDYANARSAYEGMEQRAQEGADAQVMASNARFDRMTNRADGMMHPITIRGAEKDRMAWVVDGTVVFDGEGEDASLNKEESNESLFVVDDATGKIEMIPAKDVASVGNLVDSSQIKALEEEAIRSKVAAEFEASTHAEVSSEDNLVSEQESQYEQPAKPAYEVGDVVTLETEDGPVSVEVQAVTADGVEVRTDEPWRGQVVQVIPTEEFEGMMKKPVEEAGVGVEESSATESNHYTEGSPERVEAGDNLIVTDEEGNDRSLKVVRRVSMRPSEKGGLEPQEDANGKIVELVDDATGETVRMWDSELAERTKGYMRPQQGVMPSPKSTEGEGVEQAESAQPKRNEIPVDEKTGEPVYEAADPGAAWDALVEEAEGDEELAMEAVNSMVRDMEEKLKKAKNAKLRAGATAHEKMEAQKERKRRIAEAEERLEAWKRIAGVKAERAAAAESPAVESPVSESSVSESPVAESPATVETPAAEEATPVQEGAQTPVQEGARGGVQVPHADSAGQEATQDSVTGAAPVAEQTGTTPKGVEAIPTRKNNKGEEEVLYHKVPVARTMADLYDGGMDQEEIDGFVEANSAEAAREVKRIEGKKPKMTTNKAKYMEAKRAWQAELDEAREKEAYWKEVGKEVKRVTHRDEAPVSAEGRGHEAALGEDMPKDEPMDVYEVVASALGRGRIKITPESFRAETGYSVNDQKKYPGMVASAENGGVSVERAAEMLMEDADMAGFPSDDYTIRQAIIEVLQDGHPAGYISRRREEARRRAAERDEREREEYYQDRYGMNADDGMAYEETAVPNALNQYGGVSEDELAAQSAEAAEAERMKREEDEQGNRGEEGGQQMAGKEEGAGNEAASEVEEMPAAHEPAVDSSMPKTSFTQDEAADFVDKMEARAESVPEMELTIENWDSLFGEDGRVETPIGEVKMGENQFAKLMRQGRNGKLGMIKPTLESPDIIIEQASMAKEGDVTERPSSYLFIKAFTKPDGERFYYFTSVSVSRDGKEVIISNQEKSRNKILRLMTEESVIWRTPNDAATSSAEKQGLDYAHPNNAEDETKGSGITPQSTSSAGKVTESQETEQVGARDKAEAAKSAALTLAEVRELAKAAPSCELDRAGRERVFDFGEIEKEFGFDDSVLPSRRASVIESAVRAFADGEGERRSFEDFAQSYHREEFGPVIKDEELRRLYDLLSSRADRATSEQRAAEAKTEKYGEELMLERLRQIDGLTQEDIDRIYKELQALQLDMTDMNHAEETELYLTESHLVRGMIQGVAMMEHELGKVREERAHGGAQAVGQGKVDNQGNPLNEDGSLKVEMVQSVDELTDEDFTNPSRNVQLPALPENIDNAIGVNGKPVVIKKNIFGRNAERHNDLTPAESREILLSALYNPDLYGQNQKRKRPYNWVVINTKDEKGHNRVVLLEVNENKDNVEIVHWHYLDERGLEKIRRQAANEDGQLLILPSEKTEEVGALSDPIHDLSSAGKVTESKETEQVGARVKAEGEEAEVSKDETPKEYKYRRNSDIDTLPDGYLRLGKDERGFDVAFYDHPLSRKEVERFHMGPITESNELVGKVYEVTRGLVTITYRVVGAEDGFVLFTENGSFDYRTLPYYKFMDWVVAKGKEVGTEVKASGKAREARAKDGTQPVSESEAGLRDALVDVARAAGVEVVTDSKEGQRVLDEVNGKARLSAKQKRALETASLGNDPRSLTVVSSATGAKVLNNLDALAASLENSATQPKIFLGQVANALGASNKGSSSQYATFETKNGAVVTIRLANHNASTKRMDNAGRNNAISIVVSPKPNEGVLDDGNAHVVEFYYDSIKLRKADGHPLAEIVRSIQQALYSGEYKDTTGLAERQEVNTTFENLREHRVFHGSGAEFEEFDHSHMGEGEGAQAYGWGTYVTEVEGIGRAYARNPWQMKINELESNISRAKEKLPFMPPSATKTELENNIKEWEEELAKLENGNKHLYTVEIPEDNGENYLHWEKPLTREQLSSVAEALKADGWSEAEGNHPTFTKNDNKIVLNERAAGSDVYAELEEAMGSQQKASEFLSSIGFTGISYPAQFRSGGREDNSRNFVIFNEKDAQITDHVRFFKTENGEAYGFTVGGKVYLDPKIATTETAVHELTHLWADMLRKENPKEWKHVVELMKGTPVWDEVKAKYPELKTEDEIADEVLAHYSGRRGAERLRAEQQRLAREEGVSMLDRASAVAAIERVKDALNSFWKKVADLLGIHFKSAEEVADAALADILNGRVKLTAAEGMKEDRKELVAVHNITKDKLKQAMELGGFPMPSIAITKAGMGHTSFGDISLVFDKESINPTDKRNKVYGEDAWTPVFPGVGYKLNDKKTAEIYRRANNVAREKDLPFYNPAMFHPDNYINKVGANGVTDLVEYFKNSYDAKQMYLAEMGNAVTEYVKREEEKYSPKHIRLYEKMLEEIGLERLQNESLEELRDEIKRLYKEYGDVDIDQKPQRVERAYLDGAKRKAVDYARYGNRNVVDDVFATQREIDGRIDQQQFEEWLGEMFSGIVEKKGVRNDKDAYTPSGNARKWEQLYDEITLDNVVAAMQKQAAKGGEGLFGRNIFGSAQAEYKSIDEIRKAAKERIRTINEEEYQTQRSAITDRLSAIEIPGSGSGFLGSMEMEQHIHDAVSKSHTAKGIHKYLKKFYPGITMETAEEIADIVQDIQHMSARYFEAKPYRAVGFDEVKLAVVPSDMDAALKERLEQMGIEVRTYASGDQAQRKRVVDEATEELRIRFQLVGEKGEKNMVSPLEMSEEEKHERGVQLVNAPAVDVASGQIVKTDNMSARKAAEQWWGEHVPSPLHYQTEIGEVVIDDNSIGNSLAHRYGQAKLDAITSLEEGFVNAVYLGSMKDFSRDGNVFNHYFAYPINYDGKRNYVFCRALNDANGNRLYVHEVFVADKIEKGNTLQTAASQPHGGIALYKDILANVLDAAKVAQSFDKTNVDVSLLDVDGKPIVVKAEDGSVELNYNTWQAEKEQVREALEDGGLDPEAVDAIMSQAEVVSEAVKAMGNTYPMFGAFQNKEAGKQPILRNTGEYLSWDYSFNCVKKDALNAVIEMMVSEGKGAHLGITQMEALKKVLQKHGFLTPCVMCYVEAKRKVYKQSKEASDKWNAVAEAAGLPVEKIGKKRELTAGQEQILTELAGGKGLERVENFTTKDGEGIKADTIKKTAKLMLLSPELRGRMEYTDMMSPSSFSALYNQLAHTGLMEFLTQGQSRGKSLLNAVPFSLNSIPRELFDEMYNPVKLAKIGGLRQFSYEDARATMFFDYYQQFMLMQGARALEHLYTKRPFMPEMFGRTGAMMNQSLIVDIFKGADWHREALGMDAKVYDEWLREHAGFVPAGALPKTDSRYREGGMELVPYYSVESFPVDIAMQNIHNPAYRSCVGNTIVAPSVKFIQWALDNPNIHMILAYHAAGANPVMKSLTGYDLATGMDDGYHTKKDGKSIDNLYVPEIGLEIVGKALQWNLLLRKHKDARKAAQVYLDYCKEHGLTPMFCYEGVVDMSGDKAVSHPNYYKLLTDFRVYDDNGNPVRQRGVKMELPENWQEILGRYLQQEQQSGDAIEKIALSDELKQEIEDVTRYASMEPGERSTFTSLLTDIYGKDNVTVCDTETFDKMLDESSDGVKADTLRNRNGIVYGFATGEKIVLNEDLFNAHTPMHEHTHIYMKVLQATNPKLYARGMELWRDTPLWNDARRGLEMLGETPTDEKVFSECVAQFTGAENEKIISEVTGITDKNWLKKALSWIQEMWEGVKSSFSRWTGKDLEGLTAEQFAAMPVRAIYDAKERNVYKEKLEQYKQAVEALGGDAAGVEGHVSLGEDLEAVNERFNEQLSRYGRGMMDANEVFHLGRPHGVMQLFLPNIPIVMRQRVITKGTAKKHEVDVQAIINMPQHLSNPVFVFQRSKDILGVLTDMRDRNGKNVCVAIELKRQIQKGGDYFEVNDIRSFHGREFKNIVEPIVKNDTLRWVDKAKGLAYLSSASQPVQQEIDKQDLDSAAKVVEEFENPNVQGQETDDASYREVEQGELLDELRKASQEGRTVRVYRTMQVIDGKLYSPMAKKVAGQETSEIKFRWEAAEEHPELARRGDGSKAMPNEESFYITIDKGQGKGALTVAYNPYTHTSRTVLNDQFSSAFVRPNLVVVEVEVPESELEGLYKAEKAKDSVGEMSWHSGAVSGKLAELGNPRKVILSRYDRPVRILTKKEEAELIAKQLEGTGIAMPYNLVTPQVREELEKLGVKIDEKPSGSVSKNASFGKAEYVTDEQIEAMNGRLQANAVSSPEAMTEAARALSEQLGVPVEIVTDVDSITHPNEAVEVKRRGAKGWYDKRTGKVAIVVPNHLDVEDVAATVFHEVVAHRGLRELVGEQGYDEFLMEVFNHSKADVRERMMALAGKHGWDIPKAVDEYLGGLAERGFDDFSEAERGMWTWLKEKVLEAIDKFIGTLKLPKSVKLGDNELRYLLWRSHENLRAGREGMVKRAMDVAKRYELGLLENEAGERMIAGLETYRSAENRGNTRALPIRERAKAVAHLKPVLVERNEMSKEELRQIYNALPDAVKDGRSISFYHSAFKKNYKEGGLFAQVLPKLNEILKGSVFAYSEKDNRGGEVRPDGTVHKYHPNANAFDNYVGKVEIDGKEYYVRITVQEQQGQVGTHSFFVTSVDVYEKPVNGLSVPNFPSGESDHQRVVDAKLRQFFDEARREDKASEEEDLYRTAYHEAAARDAYERRVKSGLYQSREALQDSMLGLRTAMEEVLKAEGSGYSGRVEDIPGFENAYLGENRLSSVNQAEVDEFGRRLFKPLLEIAASFGSSKEARQALTDYMMAKHGLERNALMRERAKKKAMEELEGDALQKKLDSIEKRDFAGLTALTGKKKVVDAEQAARKMVADFEQASGQNGDPNRIDKLWKAVRGVTGATLKKMKDSGLITKKLFDEISGMYDFYIPLRGFDGQTAEDVYDYLGHGGNGSAFTSPIKKAEGRKSKADDPFAYMAAMAESAIMQGNRNVLVKQKFLNFVLNHPSDLVSVSDLWLRYDAAAGEWRVAQSGDIVGTEKLEEGDSPEEVERKMAVFEERMQAEAKAHPKEYKRQKEHPEIPYRVVEKQDLREHQVIVKRNGRDYVLTINGSPRAAQALNGLTNPNLDVSGVAGTLMNGVRNTTNYLSQVYTTRNPNFVGSNWVRDAVYSNIMAGLKEDKKYGLEFSKAWLEANPRSMKKLYSLYEHGELDMNNEKQRLFAEFMANGGETGYMSFRQIEERKNEIERQLKLYGGKMSLKKGWSDAWNLVDYANRVVENQSRFAAYMASRRSGRTIDRSIYDAKEITVNFNKKGAGSTFYNAKNQTLAGKVAGGVSGIGRFGFAFWNAAIQGTTNFARFVKRNPKKGVAVSLATMALGYVVPLLASIFHDDDDDKEGSGYFDLPDAVRRDNFVFRFPGMDSWITIPLPVEYRALYGLGELTATAMYRASIGMPMTAGEIAGQAMGQISQLMPLDLSEGGGMDFTWGASGNFNALAPSAVKPVAEAWTNKSWTGLPVYKDTPYNKQDPEWTKAFKNTNTFLVKMCKQLNEWTGGDSVKGGAVDLNPAVMEHLLKGYLGGIMQTADQFGKLGETVFGDRENEFRNWPVVSRFLREGDERTKWRAVTERYFNLKKEAEETDRLLKRYKKLTELGDDHQADIDELVKTDAYKRMEVYDFFENDIRKIQDVLKRNDLSEEEREQVEEELNKIRLELLKAVDELGNLTGLGTGRLGAVTGDLFAE